MAFAMVRIHGNTVVPERADGTFQAVDGIPWTDRVGLPRGGGKTFRLGTEKVTWFHLSIPTVDNLDGARMYLDQFYVFWTSDLKAACGVTDVHVYDGSARLWTWHSPEVMAGDWSNPRDVSLSDGGHLSNTWVPRDRKSGERIGFNTALGISLQAGSVEPGEITFHSAGCNWVDRQRS